VALSKGERETGADRHGYYIAALARGLAVLDAFGPHRHELSLKEVAVAARVSQPSALRIGHTLIECGYLVRNPATKGYRLGPHALSIGLPTLTMTLPDIAEPHLAALRNDIDETVKLAVPDGTEVVVIAHMTSLSFPSTTKAVGSRMPVTVSSLGRAVLAWQPRTTIDAVIEAAKPHRWTAKTIPKAHLRAELERTCERGYAVNDQGTTVEHRSVAAPLRDASGQLIASINISTSARRTSLVHLERRLAPQLVHAAAAISSMLPPRVRGAGQLTLPT